ncbi:MAG: hydrogenase maturation protease [Bacteroidota bacterium]|nr:hydrogenase maturation protease [Bacteroidota bacterium]
MCEQKIKPATLVIGIGNMGRNDDGLGWNFAEEIEHMNVPNTACVFRFQLQIEDAHLISQYERIFFADASHQSIDNGFEINECRPVNHFYFSSHSQSPETILYLAKELYQKDPVAYTVAIAGEDWDFENELSETAKHNLGKALKGFEKYCL